MSGRKLDWIGGRHDERSRSFAIGDVLPPAEPTARIWNPGPLLDQGSEGACVGFGWSGELASSPVRVKHVDDAYARELYHRAQQLDEWEGDAYEGTSVLAGAKACAERGLVGQYRWAFSIEELRDAVIQEGPAVLGIPWHDGMYETRPSGLVDVSGSIVGGHCLYVYGYHPRMRIRGEGWFRRHEVFMWKNSWGPSYGQNGRGLIHAEDLAALVADFGEMCIPMRRALG